MRNTFFKIFLFCGYGFSVNAQLRTDNITHYTAHVSWPEVDGALWYDIYNNGRHITRINSNDTWIWLNASNNITVEPHDTAGTYYEPFTGIVQRAALPALSRIAGDYRPLSVTNSNGYILRGNFTAADKGKVISIAGSSRKAWYRDAPMWGHWWVKRAGAGWVEIGDSVLSNGKRLGSDLATYVQPAQFTGYIATNKVSQFRNLLKTRRRIVASGTVLLNPFMDSLYCSTILATQNQPAAFQITADRIIEGNYVFGAEDMVGDVPMLSGAYSGLNVSGWTAYYRQACFFHTAGRLVIKGMWRGPLTVPLRNQDYYQRSRFYEREPNSSANCELHFNGTFGNPTNYTTGFTGFAYNAGGMATQGKDVINITGTVAAAEAIGLRPYYSDSVSPDYNKRLLLRNLTIVGTGWDKTNGSIIRCKIERGRITVDRNQYPAFTFMQLPPKSLMIVRKVEDEPGPLNQFANASFIGYEMQDAYSATTDSDLQGEFVAVITPFDQPRQANQGHFAYVQSSTEFEATNINFTEYSGFFLRQSDALKTKGQVKQFSIFNLSTSATNTRFDHMRVLGGYSQYSPTKDVGFSCCGFLEAQGAPGLRYAIGQRLDGGVRWQIRNLPVY